MSSSGVPVNSTCVDRFKELKRPGEYIIFKVEKMEIIVEDSGKLDSYDAFIERIPQDECRWAIFFFEVEKPDGGGLRNRPIFISWSPEIAKVQQKMLYSSSKDALKRALYTYTEIQATDLSELSYETVLDKAGRGA